MGRLIDKLKAFKRENILTPDRVRGTVFITGVTALSALGYSWGAIGLWSNVDVLYINVKPLPESVLIHIKEPSIYMFGVKLVRHNGQIFIDLTFELKNIFYRADVVLCRPPVTAYLEYVFNHAGKYVRPVDDFMFSPEELDAIKEGLRFISIRKML